MPGNNSLTGGAEIREPDRHEGKNNIVPFGLRKRRRLEGQIERKLEELRGTGALANEAVEQFKIKKTLDESKAITDKLKAQNHSSRAERLNRTFKGQVSRDNAKSIATTKRAWEVMHPRKLIRVPKGTTQQQYDEILGRLYANDKAAIKQYTVKRPKGYRTASDRRMDKRKQQ